MGLTKEQQKIIEETVKNEDGVYAASAVAGSGKSFTIFQAIDYIKEHEPSAKILYIVFNKANQLQASSKLQKYAMMPGKVIATTAHSYALKKYMTVVGPFKPLSRLDWNIISDEIKSETSRGYPKYGRDVVWSKKAPFDTLHDKLTSCKLTLKTFCEEWRLKFDDTYDGPDKAKMLTIINNRGVKEEKFGIEVNGYSYISLQHIDAFEHIYKEHEKQHKYTHQMYLKNAAYCKKCGGDEWDYVFFDEAQDSNIFMLKLLEMQNIRKIYFVGDSRQSIYRFGGANENIFCTKKFDKVYSLSKSFRFSPEVARLANAIVHLDTPSQTCYGTEQVHETNRNSCAFLYRTNAKLFQDALTMAYNARLRGIDMRIDLMKLSEDDDTKKYDEFLYFIGLYYKSTDYGYYKHIQPLIPDAPPTAQLKDFETAMSKGMKFLDVYNQTYDFLSDDIHSMFAYAKDQKNFVEKYYALQECLSNYNAKNVITMITMHRSKGLEWDIVHVAEPTKLFYKDKEGVVRKSSDAIAELNLAYVSVTRARKELYAEPLRAELESLSGIFEDMPFIIRVDEMSELRKDYEEEEVAV